MLPTLRQRKVARVLFDEHHGEAWSIRPDVVRTMRPDHPEASSYVHAAGELAARDFEVSALTGPLTPAVLADADVLVIGHPSEAKWERTVDGASPLFGADELRAVAGFVQAGGGLLVLGETEEDKYGGNLNELLAPFGVRVVNGTVFDFADAQRPTWVAALAAPAADHRNLLHQVRDVRLYRAGTLEADQAGAVVLQTTASADPPLAGLLAAVSHGEGRVAVVADSDLFGDDHLADGDHRQLWLNLAYWVALPAFSSEPEVIVSEAAGHPAWVRLRDETNALRALQERDGSVDRERHDAQEVRRRAEAMAAAIAELTPLFPHEQRYLDQVRRDLRAWVEGGCGKPDFTASLAEFHPEQHRVDGIQSLVVFPMYTPNGSPETRFESLLVRTPWPEFIDTLEQSLFDNKKYVPVQLVDFTAGYQSDCAVLFPETVSVAGRPTNNFGGIFCDREAGRFQVSTSRGSDVLRIQLPPDAQALVANGDLMRETYILWDMIHDRWHSHGDLPFDPFMIRQRLPYWMYSLEELRVDMATYKSADELAREGFPFARYVKYAILFDRILRFPITGNRVRNYDGLGGQLLFAHLHRTGVVQWTDNQLLVNWDRIDEGVDELRAQVEELYRRGIDTSKVSYWMAAHDLVADVVEPNVGSQWRADRRVYSDESDARAWIDRVLDDEFPLSVFYEQLKKKLADEPAHV
jgi:hypothetical protein